MRVCPLPWPLVGKIIIERGEKNVFQNLENEKSLLYDHMKEELDEKIHRLEEDRNSVDINADLWFSNSGHLTGKRGAKGLNRMKSRRKAVTVAGPYIVYMLRDEEIIEDWTIIKKAMSQRKCDLTY